MLKKRGKTGQKDGKKYWRVFCIPRPYATKLHLVIRTQDNHSQNSKTTQRKAISTTSFKAREI
jgi:hypothetical protein